MTRAERIEKAARDLLAHREPNGCDCRANGWVCPDCRLRAALASPEEAPPAEWVGEHNPDFPPPAPAPMPDHKGMTDVEARALLADAGIDVNAAYDRLRQKIPDLDLPPLSAPAPTTPRCPACDGEGSTYIADAEGCEPFGRCPTCDGTGLAPRPSDPDTKEK